MQIYADSFAVGIVLDQELPHGIYADGFAVGIDANLYSWINNTNDIAKIE